MIVVLLVFGVALLGIVVVIVGGNYNWPIYCVVVVTIAALYCYW